MEESKKIQLSKQAIYKIAKGAIIALAGAFLTYFTSIISDTNFGQWTPLVVAGWSTLVNIARKYIQENS